jgi:hypothetical protein
LPAALGTSRVTGPAGMVLTTSMAEPWGFVAPVWLPVRSSRTSPLAALLPGVCVSGAHDGCRRLYCVP